MGLLAVKFYKLGQHLEIMEPACFGGSGEKMGNKTAGKKFPTD